VAKGIAELRKTIAEKHLELAALKKDLERHESALKLLSQDHRRPRVAKRKVRSNRKTDWNGIFKRLPPTFTSLDFRKSAGRTNKSAVYLRQVLSR
jgi:hypothetical protein